MMTEKEAIVRLLAAARAAGSKVFAPPGSPKLPGLPIEPLQPGEAIAAVLCFRCDDEHPLLEPDARIGACGRCGAGVQFRPSAPPGPRLCLICAAEALEAKA